MARSHTTALLLLLSCGSAPGPAEAPSPPAPERAQPLPVGWGERIGGVCDVSAAVLAGPDQLLIADDEKRNVLMAVPGTGAPLRDATSLNPLLEVAGMRLEIDKKDGLPRELDLEGAAVLPGAIPTAFWIGSHSGRKAKERKSKVRDAIRRPNRQVLFATPVPSDGRLTGKPFTGLRAALVDPPAPLREALAPLAGISTAGDYPNAGGLNIEGLAATPDGHLLIGFRSPVTPATGDKALVVRLDNPLEVIAGAEPVLGAATWLDLGRRGIRSLEWSDQQGAWLILAGPADYQDLERPGDPDRDGEYPTHAGYDEGFALYRWRGPDHQPVPLEVDVDTDLRPEAMVATAGGVYLISDDGKVERDGRSCAKWLASSDPTKAYARARHVALPAPE